MSLLIDYPSIFLNLFIIFLDFNGSDQDNINAFSSIAVILMYIKIILYMRVFMTTGGLVRMIIEIIYDMRYFTLIFFLAVIAFANSFHILGKNSSEDPFAG